MKSPSFIGIGVQRGGTSWLYQCFKEHPEIFMPGKEIHFFDTDYEKGLSWYSSLFDQAEHGQVSGEMTPDYIFHTHAITRLKQDCPDAKLILVLRDPLDRAISASKLLKSHGRHLDLSFSEIVAEEPWIIEQSCYFNQLSHLLKLFGREQVRIYFFEDIKGRPLKLLEDAFDFIGVDSKFVPSGFQEKHNTSSSAEFTRIVNLEKIQTALNQNIVGKQLLKVKKLAAFKRFKQWLIARSEEKSQDYFDVSPELVKLLCDDVKKLERLLEVDLSHWLKQHR